MPIYMDRHDVPRDIYPEHVAQMHQEDLKIQHIYGCKGITYWCDEERRTAFCLIEAPDKEALRRMHRDAHGDVPHQIIEVDDQLVELFLGRIEDPENTSGGELNVIRESAFRILVLVGLRTVQSKPRDTEAIRQVVRDIEQFVSDGNGRIVERNADEVIISYTTSGEAVRDAVALFKLLEKRKNSGGKMHFSISVNAGTPVTGDESLFGETLLVARRMAMTGSKKVIVTSEVRELYEKEAIGALPDNGNIKTLNRPQTEFFTRFMELLESQLQDPELRMDDLTRDLGLSKSQLYRKLRAITGLSTNLFIRNYRLSRAAHLLEKNTFTIGEVAFEVGFNSPSYFSKSFQEVYGILPSEYVKNFGRKINDA